MNSKIFTIILLVFVITILYIVGVLFIALPVWHGLTPGIIILIICLISTTGLGRVIRHTRRMSYYFKGSSSEAILALTVATSCLTIAFGIWIAIAWHSIMIGIYIGTFGFLISALLSPILMMSCNCND